MKAETIIKETNNKLSSWYSNAKKDFGVIGTGNCTIEGLNVVIRYTENGEDKEWSMRYFPVESYMVDYFFNVWAEEA